MANLVSPGYNNSVLINQILTPMEERVLNFQGLNRKSVIEDGEMSAMTNLTSDKYPVLTPRRPRGTYTMPVGAVQALQVLERFERIAMIAKKSNGSIAFFYNLSEVSNVTGLTADTKMVAINTKICFFPQKTYVEIVRTGSVVQTGAFGNLDANETLTNAGITITNEDARLNMHTPVQAANFAYDDAILITGTLSYTDSEGSSHSDVECLAACNVEEVVNNVLVLPRETFIEMTGEGATNIVFSGTVSRTMPELNQVIEWNNRLWGVSNLTNTIYACKLGDPRNWEYYQGTSLDSYYAEQGTDEDWTGCAAYSGHLIFFKQNSMTKIYGTAPSNFQVTNTVCYGVEQGSSKSVAIINDVVFYKSTLGIMAYNGGTPYCISDKLNTSFRNVVAGTEGIKYYASCETDSGNELFVFDASKGFWHKEDSTRFVDCCKMDGRLYYINDSDKKVYIINPEEASETYANISWMATFGPFTEYIENRKIYSRILLRFRAISTSSVNVYISLNEGPWELVKAFSNVSTGGEYIPIIPRRCDRYSIKLEGTGNVEVQSLTRKVRRGTVNQL